jgi:hypothetical protein
MATKTSARGTLGSLSRSAGLALSITVMTSLAARADVCRITAVGSATITCGATIPIQAVAPADVTALTALTPGTIIVVPAANTAAAGITIASANIGTFSILYSLAFGVLTALIYVWIVTLGAEGPCGARWRVLVVGQDNRYSNSKVQATAWMGVLLISYMATSFLRWRSGMDWGDASSVGISDNLLTMAGLSAAAAGGAKIITGTQSDQALLNKGAAGAPKFWRDLFRNDNGDWDVGDAQMIIVTASALVMFIYGMAMLWSGLKLAAHIDLPVPGNVLTFAFGGSLGGYLAKKIGGVAGQS